MTRIEFLMKSLIDFHHMHQRYPDEWVMHPAFFNGCVRECGEYVKARHEVGYNGVHHFEILGLPITKDATVHSAVCHTPSASETNGREG